MKTLKDFLTESSVNKHPHHALNTATKVRNHITKNVGGKALKSMGDSNPYADHQRLQHTMKKSEGKKLEKHLMENGWKRSNPAGSLYNWYDHPIHDAVSVAIQHTPENDKQPRSWLNIYGPKKAKRSNLPVYD